MNLVAEFYSTKLTTWRPSFERVVNDRSITAYLTEIRLRVSLCGRFCCIRAFVENDSNFGDFNCWSLSPSY
jgi:hypothetical protein